MGKITAKYTAIVAIVLTFFTVCAHMFPRSFASEEACVARYATALQEKTAAFEKELRKFSLQTTLNATEIVLYTKGALSVLYEDYNTVCTTLGKSFAECGTEQVKPINTGDGSSPNASPWSTGSGADVMVGGIISANESTVNAQVQCQEQASYLYEREEVVAREVLYGIVFAQRSYFLLKRFDTFLMKFQSFTQLFNTSVSLKFEAFIQGLKSLVSKDPS